MNRRRTDSSVHSPDTLLDHLPARVVLERLPVPVLAVGEDGSILFVNTAFAEMLGYTADAVTSLNFIEIFQSAPIHEPPVSVVHAYADEIVSLLHADGSVVRAKMSKSALLREDDAMALATFEDLTEQLWLRGGH